VVFERSKIRTSQKLLYSWERPHNSARVKKSVKVSFSTGRVSDIEIKKPQSDLRESPTKPSLGKDEGRKTLNKLLNKQELHW
jgi:hypothetical protein